MRRRRTAERALIVVALAALVVTGAPRPAGAAVRPPAAPSYPVPRVTTGAAQLAYDGDGPDPDILRVGSAFFAYTTGTTWGNHIGVLESDQAAAGYRTYTGHTWGSTALGPVPAWQKDDTQTSPGVIAWAGGYVMFYDAVDRANGDYCISEAMATSPLGPFVDQSSGPLICQPGQGGSVDPSPFIDTSLQPWLYWKSNGGASAGAAHLWGAPLSTTGSRPALASAPRIVMNQNTVTHPWEKTIEDPSMMVIHGIHYLFFAGGKWQTPAYSEGYAVCSSAAGPCTQPQKGPILTSYGAVAGPAAGNVFTDPTGRDWISYAAWTSPCTSYGCGGKRRLYVAPLSLVAPPHH
jgi:beta-xylosidase